MKNLLLLIVILFSLNSFGQSWDELLYQGKMERANGNFEKAADLIFQGAELKEKKNFEHYYYSGVLYARVNNIDSSFKALKNSIQ